MESYIESNRDLWDKWTRLHVKSEFYNVPGFIVGRNTLHSVERAALGDVSGKSLLHLQCHFGMDTLSWARLGARVTGVDFSPEAIRAARELGSEIGVDAEFVCSNVYDAPSVLTGTFDIVYTGGGAIYWLPDLSKWAEVIAHFLKPGGTFFVCDAHPFAMMFENEGDVKDLVVKYPYFHSNVPMRWETHGSYAAPDADVQGVEYGWQHSMSDIVNSLVRARLELVELVEFPYIGWQMFPFMEKGQDGWWRLPAKFMQIPLMFSLVARRV